MVIVPEKLTKEMIEAAIGFCWTNDEKGIVVQAMWDAMLEAGEQVNIAEKNAVYKLGFKYGREELQDNIKELLNINECKCED